MGEVIRGDAAMEDILADVKTAFQRASERGGVWKEVADRKFAVTLPIVERIETRLAEVKKTEAPLAYKAEMVDEKSDENLHRIYDEIFNDLGRPGSDPMLRVLFPDGVGTMVNTDRDGQPARMKLVANLFEQRVHPGIDAGKSAQYAATILADAQALSAANAALEGPRTEVRQLERTLRSLARGARVELARFKRIMLGNGFSQTDIHSVIPDRPRASTPKAA